MPETSVREPVVRWSLEIRSLGPQLLFFRDNCARVVPLAGVNLVPRGWSSMERRGPGISQCVSAVWAKRFVLRPLSLALQWWHYSLSRAGSSWTGWSVSDVTRISRERWISGDLDGGNYSVAYFENSRRIIRELRGYYTLVWWRNRQMDDVLINEKKRTIIVIKNIVNVKLQLG